MTARDVKQPAASPWLALMHPVPVAAIALTALNDHLLKQGHLLPAAVTGKLSDVAGLFFFPIAVVTAARAARQRFGWRWRGERYGSLAVALTTALAFAVCKLSPAVCSWLSAAVLVVPDPTDLVALPAIAWAWWWLTRRRPDDAFTSPAWARLVVLAAAAVTTAATSPIRGPFIYQPLPTWTVAEPGPRPLACADVELWVSKSGQEGLGLTVGLRPRGAPCTVRIDRLTVLLPGHAPYPAAGHPEDVASTGTEPLYRYLAVPFDAAARRAKWRDGSAELELTDAAGSHALRFALSYGRSATPTWGTFHDDTQHLPCAGTGELLVTDTAPDGIHLLLRAHPQLACTLVVSQVEIRSGETTVISVATGLTANLRPGVEAQVPLFVPLEATRRGDLDRKVLRAWLQVRREGQDPDWFAWQIDLSPRAVPGDADVSRSVRAGGGPGAHRVRVRDLPDRRRTPWTRGALAAAQRAGRARRRDRRTGLGAHAGGQPRRPGGSGLEAGRR